MNPWILVFSNSFGADHEVLIGIDPFSRSYHAVPPPGFFVFCTVVARHMGLTGKGMQDQDGIAFFRIQGSVGFIGQANGP